ncbi:hypothetical protein GGS21DRAFT_294777 [Xylaria nigripes]|nr:hypothetical protein GGS21DRAFT_294777 [Xylaria nigripes]
MASERPEYYNMARYGVPINDLDSIGTTSVFSIAIIWMGLPRQDIYPCKQEILDYLALQRYVAHLLDVPHDCMASPESAKHMLEFIAASEVQPSATSSNLANNIIMDSWTRRPHKPRTSSCARKYTG